MLNARTDIQHVVKAKNKALVVILYSSKEHALILTFSVNFSSIARIPCLKN